MAKIDFPKKQEQRLIPKYLLEYTEELQENHPDPTAPWGGGGGSPIEAGTGIVITGDDTKTISLDTNPETFEVTADTGMTLEVENENPLWKDSKLQMTSAGSTRLEGTEISLEANNIYLNSNNAPFYVNNTTHEYKTLATTDQLFSGDYDDLYNKPTIPDAVSGTNDGTNWTSLTIGEDTYGLASGGSTYTAGTGIDITGTTISVDTNTVAMQTDIPTNYVTTDTTQNITGGKTFNNNITVNGNITVDNYGIISSPWYRTYNGYLAYDSIDPINNWTSYNNHTITQELDGSTYTILLPNANGTMALTSDIPTDLSDLNNDAGYITGINSSDVITALGYTPGTSNFSGSYTDLTDKPTIGDGLITIQKNGTTVNNFRTNQSTNKTINISVPTATSDLTNDSGFITGINSSDVINALGYTPGTSNFSGSYTDLTDKPTIPTVNDPTITFTQGGVTKGTITLNQSSNQTIALDAGGSSGSGNMIDIGPITTSTFNLTADQLAAVEDGASINLTLAYPLVTFTYSYVFHPWTYDSDVHSYYVYRSYSIDPALGNVGPSVFIRELRITAQGACTYAYQTINLSKVASTGDYADLTNTPDLSIYAESADLATVATSGSYNDLSNKPTIPTVNDNTITITQGGVTKGSFTLNQNTNQTIEVDDVPGMIGEVLYDVPNGVQNATSLTMAHSFADYSYVDIQYRIFDSPDYVQSARIYDPNGKMISLDWKMNTDWTNSNVYGKCSRYTLSGTTMLVVNESGYEYYNNTMAGVSHKNYQYQILITKVIGYKQNSAPIVIPEVPVLETGTLTKGAGVDGTNWINTAAYRYGKIAVITFNARMTSNGTHVLTVPWLPVSKWNVDLAAGTNTGKRAVIDTDGKLILDSSIGSVAWVNASIVYITQ